MNPQLESAAGSPIWQLVFLSFGLVLIAYEVLRGWRSGVARQIARLGAVAAAYFAAFYGGTLVAPLIKPFVTLPDGLLSIFGGALLALAVYAIISALGVIAFKRTSDHQSAAVRLLYGSAGAVLGLFFGVLLMCLLVIGVRSLGAVADGEVRQKTAEAAVTHAVEMRIGVPPQAVAGSADLLTLLARLKNSLEFGVIGDAVTRIDLVPEHVYDDLDKVGQVASNPRCAQRLLSFPGAQQVTENPRIVALRDDPEIAELVSHGRFVDLLRNEKILDAFNDPLLMEQIKRFDIDAALDYALERDH
jgi:hypothetical protein